MKYRGLITTWYDREISAGEEWAQEIEIRLNKAQVILLLISASFMASDYCYSIEMRQALERYERHEADVIPLLLRPVLYTDAPFAKLQMLPTNGKPIVLWRDRDSAFVDVAYAIERVAKKYLPLAQTTIRPPMEQMPSGSEQVPPAVSQEQSLESEHVATPSGQNVPPTRNQRLSLLPLVVVGLVICVLSSTSLVFYYSIRNGAISNPTPISTATSSISTPTPILPTPTPTPTTPISATGVSLIFILGVLLLVSIIAALIAIRSIRAKNEQKRVQEATEDTRKRKYFEDAIEAYRNALAHNPRDADALGGMGNALYSLGNYDQALDAFTRAIDCKSTPTAYAGLGNVFVKLQRYSEAVEAFEKAIELDPTVTLNYDDYTQALRTLGRKEEADRIHAKARHLGYEDLE